MTGTEDRVAEALHASAPRTTGVELADIAELVRRRRASRASVIATASVLVVGTAMAGGFVALDAPWRAQPPATATGPTSPAPSGPAAPDGVDLTGAIPWTGATAPAYRPPDAGGDARACTASEVAAAVGGTDGAGGHLLTTLRFTNTGSTPCVLSGYPAVTATEQGRPDVLATDGSWFPTAGSAVMQPGDQTLLGVETDAMCDANPGGTASPDLYHHLTATLPGGGDVTVAVPGGIDVTCGVKLTPFYVESPGAASATDPLSALTVALELPEHALAGSTLVYVAAVTNPTDHAIPLTRCPGYVEQATGAADVSTSNGLACDPASSSVPAGVTVRFEMRLAVPTGARSGPLTVRWSLLAPFAVTADGTVQVTAVGGGARVAGVLELVGGPAPGPPRGLFGAVRLVDTATGRTYRAAAASDGSFRLTVPAGSYTVTGASPLYGDGAYACRADGPVSVPAAGVTGLQVGCQAP
ncbi:DUF4232 domain-containing protein [Isoptericola sp. b490]|uniref:DUF4232 domain-containing protein n=1 Tax=Actinotalea lenta TaxID=3064654 RepID=UPI002713C0E3|nr:DUF4232 domain-containing protein [Isoptericola sp. b490]MDO8121107.1 DUF4232 domain-containing protein [Isoptericola sp. b490]